MTNQAWFMLVAFLVVLVALAYPLAIFIARLADCRPFGGPIGAFERVILRAAGVDGGEMTWIRYAVDLLLFNALGVLVVYLVQRLQLWLPLNPQGFANISADTPSTPRSVSSPTPTGRAMRGESTMSYFTQMAALAVQNFLSAATGIAVAFALIRGFARRPRRTHRQFLGRLTRSTLYVLLPLSLVLAGAVHGPGGHPEFRSLQGRDAPSRA